MKATRLLQWTEKQTLDVLDSALSWAGYKVCPKVRLCDVLKADPDDALSGKDINFMMTAHFDFIICRRNTMEPVFAVEFDGPSHQEEQQVKRDIRKNRLCWRANLPLLRIGYAELKKHERITLLHFMVQRFIAWQREYPQIEAQVQGYVATLEPEELSNLIEGGVLDPSIDPGFLFNLEHPFPGIPKVARRLAARFGILTGYLSQKIVKDVLARSGMRPLRCQVVAWKTVHSGHLYVKEANYILYRHDPAIKGLAWRNGKFETPGVQVLCEGAVRFGMQWTLPTVEDYNPNESWYDYWVGTGKEPYTFPMVPGIHIPDIVEWFSEYLALKEVERWAETHLSSTV